jgi:hypothetical protein
MWIEQALRPCEYIRGAVGQCEPLSTRCTWIFEDGSLACEDLPLSQRRLSGVPGRSLNLLDGAPG